MGWRRKIYSFQGCKISGDPRGESSTWQSYGDMGRRLYGLRYGPGAECNPSHWLTWIHSVFRLDRGNGFPDKGIYPSYTWDGMA